MVRTVVGVPVECVTKEAFAKAVCAMRKSVSRIVKERIAARMAAAASAESVNRIRPVLTGFASAKPSAKMSTVAMTGVEAVVVSAPGG